MVLVSSASLGLGPCDHVLEDPLCELSVITSLDESTERVQVLGWQLTMMALSVTKLPGHITVTRDSQGQPSLDTEHGTVTPAQRRENKTQVKWVFALVNPQYFSLNCVVVLVLDLEMDIYEKHYYTCSFGIWIWAFCFVQAGFKGASSRLQIVFASLCLIN